MYTTNAFQARNSEMCVTKANYGTSQMFNKPCVMVLQTENKKLKARTQDVESLNEERGNEICLSDNSSKVVRYNKKAEVASLPIK